MSVNLIRERYGQDGIRLFHQIEDNRRKLEKLLLDRDFLIKCKIYNVFPKFLRFKLYKGSLENSKFYKSWQTKLLNNEINEKRKAIRDLLPLLLIVVMTEFPSKF